MCIRDSTHTHTHTHTQTACGITTTEDNVPLSLGATNGIAVGGVLMLVIIAFVILLLVWVYKCAQKGCKCIICGWLAVYVIASLMLYFDLHKATSFVLFVF